MFIFPGIFVYTSSAWLLHELPTLHFIPSLFQTDSTYLHKKSRLPILLKSSRSLGKVPLNSCMQKSDSKLQTNEGLKACEVQTKQLEAQTNGELVSNESVTENLEEEPAQESTSVRGK